MEKLLGTGKTDLLQFVSARTRRPFAAYLARQPDGKVGFEFEAKDPTRKGARPARAAPLRVLGAHPRDRQPVELHAGRYGPYVKHGSVNATVPDADQVDALTLDAAIDLLDAKSGRPTTKRRTGATTRARKTAETEVPAYVASAALTASRARGAGVRGAAAKTKAASRAPAAKGTPTTRRAKSTTAATVAVSASSAAGAVKATKTAARKAAGTAARKATAGAAKTARKATAARKTRS